jgi:hypothetical protein
VEADMQLSRKHGERGLEGWGHHLFGDIHLHRHATAGAAEAYRPASTIGEESGMRQAFLSTLCWDLVDMHVDGTITLNAAKIVASLKPGRLVVGEGVPSRS